MSRCLMSLGLLLLLVSAVAQDDADRQERINTIVESTRSLEDQFSQKYCEEGDVLACLLLAGLDCEMSTDSSGRTICSANGRPIYRLTHDPLTIRQHEVPKKWIVEILQQLPPARKN